MKSKIKNLIYRVYTDYFMKNRYDEYERIICELLNRGYEFITISQYEKLSNNGKHVIIRHDIDTDVKIAEKMFEIEKKCGVKTTYFFRKKTLNDLFISRIINYGSEFGYHYEEVAQYVKENRIKSKDEIIKSLPSIKKMFEINLDTIQKKYDIEFRSIAAHGDFINRKYKITNDIIFDKSMQKKYPNIIEAYDKRIEGSIDARVKDGFGPKYWDPITIDKLLLESKDNILILVHTRYWKSAPISRFKEDIGRFIEGIRY